MQPHVAIAILNWNGKKFLERFLPSVLATTYPNHSIHVIDNGSTDDSLDFLRLHFPQVRIVALGVNLGFAEGYNEGLKSIKADHYVLLNSDVEVSPGWLEPMVALLEKDPSVAACQPKILQYHQRDHFEYAGACGGWIDKLGYPFSRGRIFDVCEKDTGQYDTPTSIFWASGAALFIRASCFHDAGGFDPYFFAHMEEIDLCWRLQAMGYHLFCCPDAVVYHVGGGTLPKGNFKKVFLNFRNNLIMLSKNLPPSKVVVVVPFRLLLDAVSAWKSLLGGDLSYFRAVAYAHIIYFKWLTLPKGKNRFPVKRVLPADGYFPGLIVWRHFIKGQKTFREIVH